MTMTQQHLTRSKPLVALAAVAVAFAGVGVVAALAAPTFTPNPETPRTRVDPRTSKATVVRGTDRSNSVITDRLQYPQTIPPRTTTPVPPGF